MKREKAPSEVVFEDSLSEDELSFPKHDARGMKHGAYNNEAIGAPSGEQCASHEVVKHGT